MSLRAWRHAALARCLAVEPELLEPASSGFAGAAAGAAGAGAAAAARGLGAARSAWGAAGRRSAELAGPEVVHDRLAVLRDHDLAEQVGVVARRARPCRS